VAIIALGITALVGINTAIAAIKQKFVESFSSMGATGFTIRYQEPRRFFRNQDVKKEKKVIRKRKPPIWARLLPSGRPRTLNNSTIFLLR